MVIIYAGDATTTLQTCKANKKRTAEAQTCCRRSLMGVLSRIVCASHETQYVFLIDSVMPRPLSFAARARININKVIFENTTESTVVVR